MPIKGLTDRDSIKPRLARLGKLRKGGEKTDPRKPGKDLPYFRPDLNGEAQQAFVDAYGGEPKMVNAVLFYDTLEDNFSTWIECWDASGLVFRSDGEHWIIWREGDTYKRGKKPHRDHVDQKEIGRLEFLVPELVQQGFKGTVTLETHSKNDLLHITKILLAAEQERGTLKWAQFILRRVKESIGVPGYGDRKGQRSRADKWLVKIEPPRQMFDAMLDAPTDVVVEALPEPEEERPEHWSDDHDNAQKFWQFASDYGYKAEDVYKALDVARISDYQGTARDACATLKKNAQRGAPGNTPPPPPPPAEAQRKEQATGERPRSPDKLRAYIGKLIVDLENEDFSYSAYGDRSADEVRDNKRRSVVMALEDILGDKTKRHQLSWYLTGVKSSGDWDDDAIEALRRWIHLHKENGQWVPDDDSVTEAKAAWRDAMELLGQETMNFGEEKAPF